MTDIQLLDAMSSNRMLFTQFFLIGTIMPIGVIFAAYMFRNFSGLVRGAAMLSALIGVVMLAFFSGTVQGVFYTMLTSMSQLAAAGESQVATNVMAALGAEAGSTIAQPTWMMVASVVQILINLVLTIYLFMYAKWDKQS
jgi:hypothetical protein